MPKTVDLTNLTIETGKLLVQVQQQQLSPADYLQALAQAQGVSARWDQDTYIINFGRGLKDPAGNDLTVPELIQVVNMFIPSPLESAGKKIILQGPMPGWVSGHIARICYAASLVVETIDRAQGLLVQVPLDKLVRDHVRLCRPDTSEQERDVGHGRVQVRTSQLSYYRTTGGTTFDYPGVLELVFLETHDTRSGEPMARVRDGHGYYAWVYDLSDLEDVEV